MILMLNSTCPLTQRRRFSDEQGDHIESIADGWVLVKAAGGWIVSFPPSMILVLGSPPPAMAVQPPLNVPKPAAKKSGKTVLDK